MEYILAEIDFEKMLDVPPPNWTIQGWDFQIMIPRPGDGEFHEGIELFGGANRLRFEGGQSAKSVKKVVGATGIEPVTR